MSAAARKHAWSWFAGLLAGIIILTAAFDRGMSAYRASLPGGRNPFWFRGWFDYVSQTEPKREGEVLVLLIGNSQAFGFEWGVEKAYPALLEGELARITRKNIRVVNWSLPGGGGPDFTLLAAAAPRLKPDIVACVLHGGNFNRGFVPREDKRVELDALFTDAYQLVSLTGVRRRVSPWYRDAYMDGPLVARSMLARLWRPLLYREYLVVQLNRYPALRPYLQANLWGQYNLPAQFEHVAHGKDRRQFSLSIDLIDDFCRTAARIPARTLFIAGPSTRAKLTDGVPRNVVITERARAAGLETEDWTDLIDSAEFVTDTHLTERGHREMARVLARKLTQ